MSLDLEVPVVLETENVFKVLIIEKRDPQLRKCLQKTKL